MITITNRNLRVFFRDKSSVFFSLLSVFIVLGLYFLFLGENLTKGMKDVEGIDILISSWVISGILSITSVTTTLGAFGIMIEDRSRNIIKDFSSSPIRKSSLAGGYILSSLIIGVIMSFITLFLAEIYILTLGGKILSFFNFIKVLLLIILSVLSSNSMIFFIVTFFRSQNAFSTASSIIGTLIGFLTGVYLPIGSLPSGVQTLMKLFPTSHSASLLRGVLLENPMSVSFANAPVEIAQEFNLYMGVYYKFGDITISTMISVIFLIATSIVFYGLSIMNMKRKNT